MKNKKPTLCGLHLWAVKTNKDSGDGALWITTEKNEASHAIKKAIQFRRAEIGGKEKIAVNFLEYSGTIDA